MLIAVRYMGKVGAGVTAPQLFRADDGNVYVVKLQNNRLGQKVLVNELLASKLGEIMELCFPPSGIIEINEQTMGKSPRLQGLGVSLGQHFASRYINRTEYVAKNSLNQVTNVSDMAGVILFDHLFHNADRTNNGKNLLLRPEDSGYRIFAIDNSHLFRSGRWTIELLKALSTRLKSYCRFTYSALLKDYLMPQDFLPYMTKVAMLSDEQVDNLVAEIPGEWLAEAAERQALASYIKIRRDMVETIWKNLCKYIPKERGGRQWWPGKTKRA